MKKLIVLLLLFVTACGASSPETVVLPQFLPTATAFINESYPTAAVQVQANQVASGIDVRMEKVWLDGKNVNADVCYTLPDSSDWSIWSASLNYSGIVLQEFGSTLLSLQDGLRCDTLTFVVPPDADLTNASIAINSIAAPPKGDEYCSVYMPKIQQAMLDRGIAIVLDCVDVNGVLTMQIISIPPGMTQQQAEELVYSDEFYTITGPWLFPFNLAQ
ncbi:MAG: hypothetical protein UZ14_CFX002001648 [Chloroflexi bacterium OLB14]|nr:MAG: hypothetical protein UZ14_CFX002001648 [Chloroflexi bacterium OLB14]